jgi:hypothetical protein
MAEYVEWDIDNRAHRQRRRPRPRVEILEPLSEQSTIRVDIRHHHSGHILPQHLIIVAALLFLAVIMIRSPGALLLLAVIGWKFVAAFAIMAAIVSIVAYRERRAGRPF